MNHPRPGLYQGRAKTVPFHRALAGTRPRPLFRLGATCTRLRRCLGWLRSRLGMGIIGHLLSDPVGLQDERGHHRVDVKLGGVRSQRQLLELGEGLTYFVESDAG